MAEKVLFVAHHFPPMGGPGVVRSLNFVKNLRDFGYEPIVVTITEADSGKFGYPLDPSLLKMVPEGIEIIRIPSGKYDGLRKFLSAIRLFRVGWFFLYPLFWERTAGWPSRVVPALEKIARERNIRLVYTSSGPYTAAFVGLRLKKKMRIKWIADLRDPFTDGYWLFPGKWHWKFCRRMEKKVLSQSDMLIVNTDEVRKLYVQRNIHDPEKIITITNGF